MAYEKMMTPSERPPELIYTLLDGSSTVEKEWVMSGCGKAYSQLLEESLSRMTEEAAARAHRGQRSGIEHFHLTEEFLAQSEGWWPGARGADQAWGSGHALLTVEADYAWRVSEKGDTVEIQITKVFGRFRDYYEFEKRDRFGTEVNPGEYSRQIKGWNIPFLLRADSREADRQRMLDISGDSPPKWPVLNLPKYQGARR